MVRCWLDIDIGDPEEFARDQAAYERARRCFVALQSQYSWQGDLEQLDQEEQELLLNAYNADPKWSAQGLARLTPPRPLRAGRLVIELNESACPKATENFRALCTGERGKGKSGKPLHYKGTPFHRIARGFMAQGGDIVKGDGSAGDSIYGKPFADEKAALKLKHGAPGVVSMANSGKNSNTSQFFVTFAPAPSCDGKHVVLGCVVEGLEVLSKLEKLATTESETPSLPVRIGDCGQCT